MADKDRLLKALLPQTDKIMPEMWLEFEHPQAELVVELLKRAIVEPHIKMLCIQLDEEGELLSSLLFEPFKDAQDKMKLIDMQAAMMKASTIIIKGPSPEDIGKN